MVIFETAGFFLLSGYFLQAALAPHGGTNSDTAGMCMYYVPLGIKHKVSIQYLQSASVQANNY